MQECVLDAFFLIGIANVRMADAGLKEVEPDVWIDAGKPWVDRVSLSDAILDMPARSLRRMRYYGHRYRAPLATVRSRDDYDSAVSKKLTPCKKIGNAAKAERGDDISTRNSIDDDEMEDMCWLQDIFLVREQQLVTFSADDDSLPPLKVEKWTGNEQGPYKFLSLGYMPDNPMPVTPAQQLVLLDRLSNRLYRKLSDQADRQKNNFAYSGGKENIALRWMNSGDGQFWNAGEIADLKNSVLPCSTPGPDANVHAFFLAAQEVYNVQAGNERSLSGAGTEAETASQEQQIAAHAGGLIGYLKGQVNGFSSDVMREIGTLMWDDESLEVPSSREVAGYTMDTSWQPKSKEGSRKGLRDHYDFSVKPNSMAFVNNIANIARQGEEDSAGPGHEATKAPNTTREVVRRSQNNGPKGQGMQAVLGQTMQTNQRQGASTGGGWK